MSSTRSMTPKKMAFVMTVTGTTLTLAPMVAAPLATTAWQPLAQLWAIRGTGFVAVGALLLALAMTPVASLVRRATRDDSRSAHISALRRSLGIASAVSALAHASIAFSTYLNRSVAAIVAWPFTRAGLVALAILTSLLVTSFPPVVRRLRISLWKEQHRLAYIAAVLVAQHTLLSPFAPRLVAVVIVAVIALLLALRLVPTVRSKPASDRRSP